jgi:hypothetical protein
MRVPASLLLLAVVAAAQDYERAKAACAEAREIRREKGYAAAIDFLEPRLHHAKTLHAYADCCRWGGEEERGLRGLRTAAAPETDRLAAEVRLLQSLFRYPEAADAARRLVALGSAEHAEWARGEILFAEGQAALRGRLEARARRGAWAAAAGFLALLGAWALLRRAVGPSSARGTA